MSELKNANGELFFSAISAASQDFKEPKKRTEDFNRNDLSRVRVEILESFMNVDRTINVVLYSCFIPQQNQHVFKDVLLNSTLLDIGAKCKVLTNLDNFDKRIIGKIRELSRLRNAMAHGLITATAHSVSKGNKNVLDARVTAPHTLTINVLNSNGEMKEKNLAQEYDEYEKNYIEVIEYLENYQKERLNK